MKCDFNKFLFTEVFGYLGNEMKRLLPLFLFLMFAFTGLAGGKMDSLLLKLKTSANDTNKVILLTKIARELLYKKPEDASAYADTAISLSKQLIYRRGLSRSYTIKGIYYRNKSDYEKAFNYQLDAIKISEELKDRKLSAGGYTNMGILFKNQGNYKKSIEYHLKSKKLYEELGDRLAICNCLQNLSNTYRRNKQADIALQCCFDAIKIYDELKDEDGKASVYNSIGTIYMEEEKKPETALSYFLKMEKIGIAKNDLNNLKVCYLNLGTCNYELKKYNIALEYSQKAIKIATELDAREEMAEIYQNLANINEKLGNKEKALEFYKKYHTLGDSIAKNRYKKTTLELEEKYQNEKSQKEIELLSSLNNMKTKENEVQKDQLKKNKIIIFAGVLFTILIAAFALLFYKNFKKTEKLNGLLTNKNNQIESQKKEILDSILYARRIQDSILPTTDELNRALPNSFVIYKPRDIVSGDFYWTYYSPLGSPSKEPLTVLALCDCTGHGVPGAFMSLISYTLLNQVVKDPKTNSPDTVLNYLSTELPKALKSEGKSGDLRDGLDIAVAAINFKTLELECSMAHIPVYICNGKEMIFLKPDKESISGDKFNSSFKYNLQKLKLNKGDRIYLTTDGFADQFGGPKGKKLKYKELEKLLLETHFYPLNQQKKYLEDFFENWKSNQEQVDDVTLIGIEV